MRIALISLLLSSALVFRAFPQQKQGTQDYEGQDFTTILMKSTFRIVGKTATGRVEGTTFILGKPVSGQPSTFRMVLVTAAHVLEGMSGDSAVLMVRRRRGQDGWEAFPWQIRIREGTHPLWLRDAQADVAAMYVSLPGDALMSSVGSELVPVGILANDDYLRRMGIAPGDTLDALGYPLDAAGPIGDFPILRSGKIASYPLLPTADTKVFLMDFPVFKGNSGGPVYFSEAVKKVGNFAAMVEPRILGLVSQEETITENVPGLYETTQHVYRLGLAVVVEATFIRKTIDSLPDAPIH